jgi:uncharacterized protein YndB with AHSA1/START domain
VKWVRIERRLDASRERVYRAWADPAEMTQWFPKRVKGSLAPGSRSELIWSRVRTWIDVVAAEPNATFVFRWPWLADDSLVTTVTVTIQPSGTGSVVRVEDGPFDVSKPGVEEAYEQCLEGWAEALAFLRAQLDFYVDLRTDDF